MHEEDMNPPERRSQDDRTVGYKRPPIERRFKKGKSGNPAGRPKGSRNKPPVTEADCVQRIILAEAYREIPVIDGGRMKMMTMLQAGMRAISVKAAKGDLRSNVFLISEVTKIAKDITNDKLEILHTAVQIKREREIELRRRKAAGEVRPEVYPHPDDIYIDWATGEPVITGPLDREQKKAWDALDRALMREVDLSEEIKALELDLAKGGQPAEDTEELRKKLKEARTEKRRVEARTKWMSLERKARRVRRLLKKHEEGE